MNKFSKGQKIIIELNDGDIIEGDFMSGSKTRLDINNWRTSITPTRNASIQHFYESEIVNIKAFENVVSPEDETETNPLPLAQILPTNSIIKIPEEQYNELKELSRTYVYMATMDSRYHSATGDLVNSETIAIAMLSTDFGRAAPVDILVAATWSQIYLFDITLYNCKHFPKELKYVLESEDIVKVVHDSRGLTDCMYHQYQIKVNNIFDTYVATLMITKEKLSLPESLTYFFNFPEFLIKHALSSEVKAQWKERPLSDDLKAMAAKNAQYLILLKTYLQKELMKEFHENVLKHSTSTLDKSPLEAHISLGCLDINK